MKRIILFAAVLVTSLHAISQTDSLRKTVATTPVKKVAVGTDTKPATIQPQGDKLIRDPKLPDLKIVSFTVSYVNSLVVDGKTKHTIEINYSLKNEGTVAVSKNSFGVQGWISYDAAFPKSIPACGQTVSSFANDMLKPGDSHAGSFRCTAEFNKNNRIVYTLYVDEDNTVKELSEGNNSAQLTIQL